MTEPLNATFDALMRFNLYAWLAGCTVISLTTRSTLRTANQAEIASKECLLLSNDQMRIHPNSVVIGMMMIPRTRGISGDWGGRAGGRRNVK